MGLVNWIRRLFSASGAEDDAAEPEVYGLPDRGEAALERGRLGSFVGSETAQAAEEELGEFKAPRDPAP